MGASSPQRAVHYLPTKRTSDVSKNSLEPLIPNATGQNKESVEEQKKSLIEKDQSKVDPKHSASTTSESNSVLINKSTMTKQGGKESELKSSVKSSISGSVVNAIPIHIKITGIEDYVQEDETHLVINLSNRTL